MSKNKVIARSAAVLLGVMLIAFGMFGVLAEPDENPGGDDPQIVTEAPQPETEAPQPVTEEPQPETEAPQPETEAPQPVTEKPEEPETEYVAPETEYQDPNYYMNDVEDPNTGTTKFFIPPTVPKTVSQKTYSTNYAFGAVSWICAGVGIVVILAVAISTKAGGRKNGGTYDRFPNR